VRQQLEASGCEVTTAGAPAEAREILAAGKFDLYIFDQPWRYPLATLELCRFVRQTDSSTPILVFSVLTGESDRNKAQAAGANEFLIKPDDINRLPETVSHLLQKRMASRGNF
jgi:DNA-binding response OmpR family regulator